MAIREVIEAVEVTAPPDSQGRDARCEYDGVIAGEP